MPDKTLYSDNLVTITEDSIILKNYYFPLPLSKKARFSNIESIEVKEPGLLNGQYRIWGSGNFRTWFPLDALRPSRDRIFIITYRDQWFKSGFTVTDAAKTESILRKTGLVR